MIADTSWLYALLDKGDQHHDEAVKQAEVEREVRIAPETFAEFVHLLAARRSQQGATTARKEAVAAAHAILATPTIRVVADIDPSAALDIVAQHRGLSYADACGIALARRRRVGLLTFDQRQARAL